jgi:pterin-4a-carbinolamine dehydratase
MRQWINIVEGRSDPIEDFVPSDQFLDDAKSKFLPNWEMLDHKILQTTYVAQDHRHAEEFIEFINRESERMDHFTEVTQDVAEVTVKTTTSDVKGLTILDFKLAMIIDDYAKRNKIDQGRMQGNF